MHKVIYRWITQGRAQALNWWYQALPQETVCAGCGATLYKGFDPEPPEETARRHNGVCPNCGRKLGREPEEVEIISLIKELAVKARFK